MSSIVILKNSFNTQGGLEKQTLYICNALIERGIHVTLLTTELKNKDLLPKDICYVIGKKLPFFSFLKIFYFNFFSNRWINKNKPKVVLGIDRTSLQTHIRAGNGVHRAYLKKKDTFLNRRLLDKINPLNRLILSIEKKSFENQNLKKIIVNSHMVKDQILEYYNVAPSKILTIHNGTDWKKFEEPFTQSLKVQKELKKRFKIDPGTFTFLFAGNGYKRKGADLLLKAASLLNLNFHLLFLGKEKNIKRYERLAKSFSLKNVTFLGYQKDLSLYYQMADACILPTLYDPFSNVILEALAMGLYCITSKENGAHEIINEKNGIIIQNLLDIAEIANCMRIACTKPKNSTNARQIRDSVKALDLSNQIPKVVQALLNDE